MVVVAFGSYGKLSFVVAALAAVAAANTNALLTAIGRPTRRSEAA
jgi:hypothetical protein